MIKLVVLFMIFFNGDDGGHVTTDKLYFMNMDQCKSALRDIRNSRALNAYMGHRTPVLKCIESYEIKRR